MLAGMLRNAGYFMGERLIPASSANPKGFFEDREINSINEALLSAITPNRPPVADPEMAEDDRTLWGWRWLSRVPVGIEIPFPKTLTRVADAGLKAVPDFLLKLR